MSKKLKFFLLIISITFFFVVPALLWNIAKSRRFQFFGKLTSRVETKQKVVALTFDDGPTVAYTKSTLQMLEKLHLKATFFVTGRDTEQNMKQAKMLVRAGHQLGNHSYGHQRMFLKTPSFVREELEKTDQAIRMAGYKGEIFFRPPFGKKLFVLPWLLAERGTQTIMWDIEPETFPRHSKNTKALTDYVVQKTRPGSIILLHLMYRSRKTSRSALPFIVKRLRSKGYRFVTISQLLSMK